MHDILNPPKRFPSFNLDKYPRYSTHSTGNTPNSQFFGR